MIAHLLMALVPLFAAATTSAPLQIHNGDEVIVTVTTTVSGSDLQPSPIFLGPLRAT